MPTVSTVELVTPSALDEPITLDQAKRHLGFALSDVNHNEYLKDLIEATRETFEGDTGGYVCRESTFCERFDTWPEMEFKLHRWPLIAVTHIKYIDADGTLQTLSTSVYTVDSNRTFPTIWLAHNQTWPTIRGDRNGIRITYTAGHAAIGESQVADVPQDIKQALLLKIGERFENRQGFVEKTSSFNAYDAIVARYARSDYP